MEIFLFGAGGHAAVVLDLCETLGIGVSGIYDDISSSLKNFPKYPFLGKICDLPQEFSGPSIIAIGNNQVRQKISKQFPFCEWVSLVHPSAQIGTGVKIGRGAVIFAGSVVQARAKVGDHVIVNTSATVDHDCIIDDFAHIAPGCNLSGNVRIGEGSLMGVGSCSVPNMEIGEWSIVGAGGVVVSNIPPGSTAVGVPAKVVKRIF